MVELQAKKNDNHLMISQNYLLGLSFFFMAVGLLWGVRYVAGYVPNGVRLGGQPISNYLGEDVDGVFDGKGAN